MRLPTSLNDNSGFTLVEVMVATVIMAVGLLGLLQAVGVALDHNMRNELRGQAVYLGEKYMNELRGQSFDNYSVYPGQHYSPFTVANTVRGGGGPPFTIERVVQDIGSQYNKQLQVTVTYTYKNQQYQNRVTAQLAQTPE